MRRVLVVMLLLLFVGAGPALADHDTTTTITPAVETPSIIPKPNQGVEPTDAGDRGGALQVATFVLIVGGIGVIGAVVVRQSRAARAGRSTSGI